MQKVSTQTGTKIALLIAGLLVAAAVIAAPTAPAASNAGIYLPKCIRACSQ